MPGIDQKWDEFLVHIKYKLVRTGGGLRTATHGNWEATEMFAIGTSRDIVASVMTEINRV